MHHRTLWIAVSVLALACGDDGGASGSSTGSGSTSGASSGGSSSGGSTGGGASTSTGGGGSSGASTSAGTTGVDSSGSSGSSGAADSTSAAGSSSGGATTGATIVATFSCTETSIVDAPMVETIVGAFAEDGTPHDVVAQYVQSGTVDFAVDVALPVADDDPYAADVTYWEESLTMQGWDVNPPDDPSGDRRYFFAPAGAENVAIFAAFYYRVYEAGGNGQFEFDCVTQ